MVAPNVVKKVIRLLPSANAHAKICMPRAIGKRRQPRRVAAGFGG
jgi:hypothetical protein